MNMIDRYVTEVGRNLPLLKGREDIEKELKSTLEDMLEDRAEQTGRVRDEAMEIEVLKEYGSPQKVAATYNPQPYLIGPKLFPFFLFVLKIVITVVVSVMLVLAGVQAVTDTPFMGSDFVKIIGGGLGNALSAAIAAFGNVVVVFAILERVLPEKEIGGFNEEKDWDPAALAKDPHPDSISRFELITEIVFTFVALAILNIYPQWLGMFFFVDGEQTFIPMFTKNFFQFVPWINVVIVAEILLDVYLLRTAAWDIMTRILKILIEAASLTLTVLILRTPDILGFNAESFVNGPFSAEQAEVFVTVATYTIPIVLAIIVIIQSIELVKAVYKLIRMSTRAR
ncbi:MAG: hypothetical protein IPG80_06505 [Anaerolineales bacterium]|uniref:hypothetical protein n=1 Tax=Candidatus Villigracilis vicinus TaxID=3140679 RepID=UPI0031352303|nr:hypothetical protein [Anaerolineales bacterium]